MVFPSLLWLFCWKCWSFSTKRYQIPTLNFGKTLHMETETELPSSSTENPSRSDSLVNNCFLSAQQTIFESWLIQDWFPKGKEVDGITCLFILADCWVNQSCRQLPNILDLGQTASLGRRQVLRSQLVWQIISLYSRTISVLIAYTFSC